MRRKNKNDEIVDKVIRFGPTRIQQPKVLQYVSIPSFNIFIVAIVLALTDAARPWGFNLGNTDRSAGPALEVSRLLGNLTHVAVGVGIFGLWSVLTKRIHAINFFIVFISGAVGGIAREYAIGQTWADHTAHERIISVASSGLWFVFTALLAKLIGEFVLTVLRDRNSLLEAIRAEQTSRELLLTAETQLRRDVSERLHGPLQAELINAVHELRCMGGIGDKLADRLDHVRKHEVRQLSHSLHPSLVDIDLATALMELRDLHAREGVINLDISGLETEPLPPHLITGQLSLAIHRIVEEGISNAFRHGGANRIDVSVSVSPVEVELTITDDGSGLAEVIAPGVGVRMVHTWVRAFNGTWDLTSHPDEGTVLHAVFPLTEESSDLHETVGLFANDSAN